MITKSDWEAVQQEMSEEDRRKLGEPPTAEAMLAYSRGELSGEKAGHVRAWLACNPDLVRALMEPFPAGDAKPGDPDFLSSEEMAKQWAILQQRIGDAPSGMARVYQFPSRWTALAAAMALVFAGLYWQAESKSRRLTRELHEPQALESQLLMPDGRRGGVDQATPLSAQGDRIALDLALFDATRFETYRVEMRDTNADPAQPPWRSDAIRAAGEETLTINVSRTYLKPGTYQIVVHGIDGIREQRLDTYTLRVP